MSNHSHYKVGCDAHKHYSLFSVLDARGHLIQRTRVNHAPGAIRAFLSQFPPGTPVARETGGNWYWIVDEIEEAGCLPLLAHAAKAKSMMGHVHKTDKLDASGLATLLRMGTLPAVWGPPRDSRDHSRPHRPPTHPPLREPGARAARPASGSYSASRSTYSAAGRNHPNPPPGHVDPWAGRDPVHRDRPGAGVDRPLPLAQAPGQLLRPRPPGPGQWRQSPLWAHDQTGEQLLEVGV